MCVWYKESKCVKIENKYTLKWKLYVWGVGQSPLGPKAQEVIGPREITWA